MMPCAPGAGRSSTGAQFMVMPSGANSCAATRAASRAASRPLPLVLGIERAEGAGRRQGAPMRRPQALHAPAFLVDQDQHVLLAQRVAEVVGQAAHLIVRVAIARRTGSTRPAADP